ncbi:MAG: hypothetical protein HYX79_03855 [Chloroflexi bacterium]|nr:hypothetical protein [Chloroflexota bacterium]
MATSRSESLDWRCPACNIGTNSEGVAFSSARAVSLHIAGKIKTGDSTHRQWAVGRVGDNIQTLRYETINTLAAEIEPSIIEARQIIEELILRSIEERDANEEPNVLAYRYIRNIEVPLHKCIRQTLVDGYGANEDEWWVKGIPLAIRRDCANRKEESTPREEPYHYTYLIDLKTIIEKNRTLFENRLRTVNKQTNHQREFLDGIGKCNDIRNRVMHTMHEISDDDLSFLKQFCSLVKQFSEDL